MRLAGRLEPAVPAKLSPATAFPAGPLLLCASLGVQVILAAILLVGPTPRRTEFLTQWGRLFYRPEREVELYVTGVALTLGLCLVVAWVWGRSFASAGRRFGKRFFVGALVLRCGLAAGATLWFLGRWMSARSEVVAGRDLSRSHLVAFAVIGFITLSAAAPLELLLRPRSRGRSSEDSPGGRTREARPWNGRAAPPSLDASVLDLLVLVGILLLTYVPAWRQLAGRVFLTDAFFHWDYYAMGPALAFQHGDALGTDFYAMYGVGWPVLFGMLPRGVFLSYGRIIQLSSIYACLYFSGVYLLMRLLLRRPGLAAAATGLAMLQLYLGMADAVVWVLPSLTVLRWAFDVWCFIALVQHRRSGRRIWAVAAGACVGLAVVFSTDTGLYLAAAVAFYWICSAWAGRGAAVRPMDAVSALAAAVGTLAAGLAVAARGSIFSSAFWTGWLEPLRDYRGGFAQAPLSTVPDQFAVICFAILVLAYLTVVGRCLAKVLYRRAGELDLLTGTFAAYGLMNLIHFVGRSVGNPFFRLAMPLAFILVLYGAQAYTRAEALAACRWRHRGRLVVPAAAVAALASLAAAALFAAPSSLLLDPVRAYPNLASRIGGGHEPDGLCLMREPKDICGLPAEFKGTVEQFHAIAESLRALKQQGRSVAIIDESGPILYLAGGHKPFGRYPRIFLNMYSKRNLSTVAAALTEERPDYVLTRRPLEDTEPAFGTWSYFGVGPRPETPYPDAWEGLLKLVQANYRLERHLAPFELWALRAKPDP